jgi:hypothetical protein
MTTSELLTLVLAAWGAAVSTAFAIWTVWHGTREDGRLRLRVYVGRVTGGRSVQPVFMFEVVNVGRRPVYFGGVSLRGEGNKVLDHPLGPPDDSYIKLGPGETCGERFDDHYQDVDKMLRARRIAAFDSHGRRIQISRWRMWQIRREIRAIQAQNEALQRQPDAKV